VVITMERVAGGARPAAWLVPTAGADAIAPLEEVQQVVAQDPVASKHQVVARIHRKGGHGLAEHRPQA
jgi:hypothetical protein